MCLYSLRTNEKSSHNIQYPVRQGLHTQSEDFLSSSTPWTNSALCLGSNGAPLEKYKVRVILLFELLKSGVIFSEEGRGIDFGTRASYDSRFDILWN